MLIPYPFALLSAATVFDIAARITSERSWSDTARHVKMAGLGTALVAAVPGIVDYFGTVPAHTTASRTATTHALCNVTALACFALSTSERQDDGRLTPRGLALSVVGTAVLFMGGWLGGQLVYHEHIGVEHAMDSDAEAGDEPSITGGDTDYRAERAIR
jgi:uncharacterized membrane protein